MQHTESESESELESNKNRSSGRTDEGSPGDDRLIIVVMRMQGGAHQGMYFAVAEKVNTEAGPSAEECSVQRAAMQLGDAFAQI
jgi:hypothetical protein